MAALSVYAFRKTGEERLKQGTAMVRIRGGVICVLALLLGALVAGNARAQADYPKRPIHFIVGFGAGGRNDLFARLVVQKFQENTGITAVIDNRVGAGGRIAGEFAARQPADGYTVLVGATGQMSIATAIFPDLGYHASNSFIPLNMIASFPLVLVVPADHPVKTVKELVAWAKANPDKSNYGTSSPAFTIASELLKLKNRHAGGRDTVQEQQQIQLECRCRTVPVHHFGRTTCNPPGPGRQDPGAGGDRFPALLWSCPMSPSMAEAGFPEVDTQLWSGFFVPVGTPAPIVTKLTAELGKALADPSVQDGLKKMAVTPGGPTGDAFKKRIDADIKTFADVVKAANLTFK